MATIRWYLVNGVDANGWQALSETAQAAATCNAGWVVGTGLTNNSELQANTERASTTFTGTTVPDGTLDLTLKDALRTPVLNGTFAAGNWAFFFAVQSPTQGGAADGTIRLRVIKADPDGANATEITSAQQSGGSFSNVSTTDANGTLSLALGAITCANQCIFIQIAWQRTGAGGMTTTNIRLRTGVNATTGTTLLSPDYTETPYVTTLQRVQGTGKARIANSAAALTMTFGSLPTVGNGVIVEVWGSDAGGVPFTFADGMVTDNQGNNYDLAVTRQAAATQMASAVFYCPKIVTSSGTFTISLAPGLGHLHWLLGAAVEIGGLGSNELTLRSSGGNASGSGATQITGNAGLTNGEAVVAAVMCLTNVVNETSITVQSLYPSWREEAEELGGATWMNGEADIRIFNYPSDFPNCTWTIAPNAAGAAAIAVFQSAVALPSRTATLTQTMAAATVVGDGEPSVAGITTRTLAAATLTAAGTVTGTYIPPGLSGVLTQTLAAATVTSAGTNATNVVLGQTLAPATLTSAGTAPSQGIPIGSLNVTLSPVVLSATGTVVAAGTNAGVLIYTLSPVVADGVITTSIGAALLRTLAGVTPNVSVAGGSTAVLSRTLQSVALVSILDKGPVLAKAEPIQWLM